MNEKKTVQCGEHEITYWLDGPHDLRCSLEHPMNALVWWEVFFCKKCEKCYSLPSTMDLRPKENRHDGVDFYSPCALDAVDAMWWTRQQLRPQMIDQIAAYFTPECVK